MATRKNMRRRWSYLLLALGICFFVTVDHAFAQSPADCEAHARYVERSSGSIVGGAARGAARGALFGAIVGGGGKGAS